MPKNPPKNSKISHIHTNNLSAKSNKSKKQDLPQEKLLDSTFAFIFLSTKSHKAIAPFEAILCDLAKKHKLDFGSEFCSSKEWIKPSELYFFVRPVNDTKANDSVANDTIIAFANSISENLPLSMDFVFKGIESAKSLQESSILPKKISHAKILHSKTTHDMTPPKNAESIPTVQEMKALLGAFEENSEGSYTPSDLSLHSVLKPFFVDIRYGNEVFGVKSAKKIAPKDSSLAVLLARLASELAEGKPVKIRTKRGDIALSVGEKSPLVMFWELGALQSFMRVNQAQISLLGSFEKPSMKLCPKEVFAKEFFDNQNQVAQSAGVANPVEIECVLAYEPLLALLGVYARARGVEFVFVKPFAKKSSEILESALTYTIPPYKRVACDKNGTYVEDRFCKLNLFSLIRKHYVQATPSQTLQNAAKIANASQMLVCYLSKSKNTAIWVYRQTPNNNQQEAQQTPQSQAPNDTFSEILHIDFSLNPAHALAEIATRENGDKLIANFASHFGEHSLDFSLGDSPKETFAKEDLEKYSKNLIEFFSVIAKVLRLCPKDASVEEGVNSVLNNAKLFLRDKGPRIDYKTVKSHQGGLALDMPRILRSAMSFSLAGVDSATLCYGVVDSLCEFVGSLARDMGQNYAIKKVFLCGDMLTESIFLDKILHYLPKDMEIILPQDGFVDFYK